MNDNLPPGIDLVLHQGLSLTLRRVLPDDAPLLMAKMYRKEFMRLFRLNDRPENLAQLRQDIQKRLQTPPQKLFYLDGVLVHRTHGIIGLAALADYSPLHRRAEFLVGLFETTHRAKSYGLEAGLMILDLGFNQYSLNRIYAYTYSYNAFAQQALKGGGFSLEGILAQHVFDSSSSLYVDLCIYGLILEKFRKNSRLARLSQRLLGRDITQAPPVNSKASALRLDFSEPTEPTSSRAWRRSGSWRSEASMVDN